MPTRGFDVVMVLVSWLFVALLGGSETLFEV
jgi:hypothetical protein